MDQRTKQANKILFLGIYINIAFTAFQIFAGIIGRSEALIADAFHTLSDLSTDFVVIWGLWAAGKPIDRDHDYGHGKIETLMTSVIGLSLLAVGGGILLHGGHDIIKSFQGTVLSEPGWIAFIAALSTVIAKEWLYHRTLSVGRRIDSPAVVAKAWHHRSDSFSSIGVTLGIGGAIILGDRWAILDPLAAVIVSVFIIKMAVSITYESIQELIEGSLSEEAKEEILNIVRSIPGAQSPHNLKTRKIGNKVSIEMHIRVSKKLNIVSAHEISTEVEKQLKARFGPESFVSVHVEPVQG